MCVCVCVCVCVCLTNHIKGRDEADLQMELHLLVLPVHLACWHAVELTVQNITKGRGRQQQLLHTLYMYNHNVPWISAIHRMCNQPLHRT